MENILQYLTSPPDLSPKRDDSFADRLNNRYTIIILMVFATVVSVQIYVGSPITCWVPKHFTSNHVKYTESYCWVRNTYYLPFEEEIPRPGEDRDMVTYYQWVPFILVGMAGLFYVPSLVWHALNNRSGVDADNILQAAHTLTDVSQENSRNNTLTVLCNMMDRFLAKRRLPLEGTTRYPCSGIRRFGSYLVILYLLVKLLYILNVLLQFLLLDVLLTTQFEAYGLDVMGGAVSDTDWTETPRVPFPRVTLCDFNIRRLGNVHRYTVQCALPINLYNEKIFLFLWFWLIFVCLVNLLDFATWLLRSFVPGDRLRYIQEHLRYGRRLNSTEEHQASVKFVHSYLKRDGVFLLRLIGHNTNKITVNELIISLWDIWLKRYSKRISLESCHQEDVEHDADKMSFADKHIV